jgi:hypothetical protein
VASRIVATPSFPFVTKSNVLGALPRSPSAYRRPLVFIRVELETLASTAPVTARRYTTPPDGLAPFHRRRLAPSRTGGPWSGLRVGSKRMKRGEAAVERHAKDRAAPSRATGGRRAIHEAVATENQAALRCGSLRVGAIAIRENECRTVSP